ncbi:MAG TPA: hypothetical protein PJ986_14740 [Gammaproteobacteria bacterium]|nr:hypothetical protein [Gammaproteobacteria bacterium]
MSQKVTKLKAADLDATFSPPGWWRSGMNPAAITDNDVFDSLSAFSRRLVSLSDVFMTAGDEGFADGTVFSLAEVLREHADQLSDFTKVLCKQRTAKATRGAA